VRIVNDSTPLARQRADAAGWSDRAACALRFRGGALTRGCCPGPSRGSTWLQRGGWQRAAPGGAVAALRAVGSCPLAAGV